MSSNSLTVTCHYILRKRKGWPPVYAHFYWVGWVKIPDLVLKLSNVNLLLIKIQIFFFLTTKLSGGVYAVHWDSLLGFLFSI